MTGSQDNKEQGWSNLTQANPFNPQLGSASVVEHFQQRTHTIPEPTDSLEEYVPEVQVGDRRGISEIT